MNVLIVCHCSDKHSTLYITDDIHKDHEQLNNTENMQNIMQKYNINHIDYIDTRCTSSSHKFWNQYTNWNDIKTKFDAIYFIACPIYTILYNINDNKSTNSIRQLILNSFNVLKPSGYIHISHNFFNYKLHIESAFNNSEITHEQLVNGNKKQKMRHAIRKLLLNHMEYKLVYKEGKTINDIPFHIL